MTSDPLMLSEKRKGVLLGGFSDVVLGRSSFRKCMWSVSNLV